MNASMLRVSVVHSMNCWLSPTMTWLHTQVRSLPPRVTNSVVCDYIDNLDQFPIENIYGGLPKNLLLRALQKRSWRFGRLRSNWLLRGCARRFEANILHSHFGDYAHRNIERAARLGLRHVVTFYGYDATRMPTIDPAWRDRYRELFATADLCLCEGPHMGRVLTALGCPAHKVRVHHLGVDVAAIAYRPRTWAKGQRLKVLMAGAFTEKKGFCLRDRGARAPEKPARFRADADRFT